MTKREREREWQEETKRERNRGTKKERIRYWDDKSEDISCSSRRNEGENNVKES
jgi:hypothetical protein